ncbi:MAG: acetate--CoA ligase family protein [Spirochaetales bacterium]|nr:acetate--CoA ligase family protein [Spirochaetales bacterium]
MDETRLSEILARAKAEGRDALTEVEGLALLDAMGVPHARHHLVAGSAEAAALAPFPGERAVVKVISPEVLHKTEAGGVAIVRNDPAEIRAAVADMEARFKGVRVDGYTVNEFVGFEPRLGHEIIVGYRFARDFGPVVSFGPGGIYTEFLASQFKAGAANLFWSPATADRALVERCLAGNAVRQLLCGGLRGTKAALDERLLVDAVMAFIEAAPALARAGVSEFEINPFVVSKGPDGHGRLVALDALVKLEDLATGDLALSANGLLVNAAGERRPVSKLGRLLKPSSAAVIGVSDKSVNNGRIILRNLLANGFERDRLYVVKEGAKEVDGCRCVSDIASLPEKVDLFVLVIPAAAAPDCIAELAELDKAESVIVIPGGLEEKSGTEAIVAHMKQALDASRRTPGGGPLLNGGNCLGVRSVPGRYNTLFIPEYKLPMPSGQMDPVALVSQSGAFAISRISKNPGVNPKYVITCGNQMDLTVGDYLDYLADDGDIQVFAVYVEGFKPLDGDKTLRACRKIRDSGRDVIFYRAGRTAAGAAASASHTASIAGDYPVTRALLAQVGVVVAESLDEFDDLVLAFTLLRGRKAGGWNLGAVSNAGFECVAMADNLGRLRMAELGPAAKARLETIFAGARISDIVDVHNPIDLTPMGDDDAYYQSFRALLNDDGIDAGLVGLVPFTARMNTLPKGHGHDEDLSRPDSLAQRFGQLAAEGGKPWVAVVDAGELFDPYAKELARRGVPTFRTADRALRILNAWLSSRGA